MTLRMTLTRPDLRADERILYPSSEPLALDDLPAMDGGSASPKPKDANVVRKFWQKVGRMAEPREKKSVLMSSSSSSSSAASEPRERPQTAIALKVRPAVEEKPRLEERERVRERERERDRDRRRGAREVPVAFRMVTSGSVDAGW